MEATTILWKRRVVACLPRSHPVDRCAKRLAFTAAEPHGPCVHLNAMG